MSKNQIGGRILGNELHTSGFSARTGLLEGGVHGFNTDYVYTTNGRFVMDLLSKLWKVRWLGIGASYFFGEHFDVWSAGADLRFQF